jgi:hypothetical protein
MLKENGLAYLDIKPENMGMLRGNLCVIDTDPTVFYKVPREFRDYYLYAQFISLVLHCFHFVPELDKAQLRDFTREVLTPDICEAIFAQNINPHRIEIATVNLPFMTPIMTQVREHHPREMSILEDIATRIKLPMEYIFHYGTRDGILAREKIEIIREWIPTRESVTNA